MNATKNETDTPAADQEIDARLTVIQDSVNSLADTIFIVEDIEAELDILADEEADPEALNAIHSHAITLLDSQQRLDAAFKTALELARALKDQREQARKTVADLKRAIEDANREVPEIDALWESIQEMVEEENSSYLWDMMYELIDDQIAFGSGLNHIEAATLTNLLTAGCIEDDHYLWDDLRDWIHRADEYTRSGITPPPTAD